MVGALTGMGVTVVSTVELPDSIPTAASLWASRSGRTKDS